MRPLWGRLEEHADRSVWLPLFGFFLLSGQVTAYTHKDDNNKWLIKHPNGSVPGLCVCACSGTRGIYYYSDVVFCQAMERKIPVVIRQKLICQFSCAMATWLFWSTLREGLFVKLILPQHYQYLSLLVSFLHEIPTYVYPCEFHSDRLWYIHGTKSRTIPMAPLLVEKRQQA